MPRRVLLPGRTGYRGARLATVGGLRQAGREGGCETALSGAPAGAASAAKACAGSEEGVHLSAPNRSSSRSTRSS